MKKLVLSMTLALTLLVGSGLLVSAATSADSCHTYADMTYGNTWTVTYTHPVGVGSDPYGNPIIVNCTAVDTWQKYNRTCVYCGHIESSGEKVISTSHQINH